MLKFSDICDDFIREQGLQKHLCATDEEAKQCAASLYSQPQPYPVIYTGSNTTGEKAYEEFYVQGEKIKTTRFQSLGVVEQSQRHSMLEVNQLFRQFESIFARPDFTKAEVVDAIKSFIPTFEHEEKGKNLDSKM